uniref:Cyclin-K n=1 Tax=Aceria tosichella TaxID=561515 RepID=A0A6G1SBN5_9ACAR
MNNPWLFDAKALKSTPSARDGYSRIEERNVRIDGAKFIKLLGTELGLHYCTVATGCVFFHRFYMRYSMKQFPVYPTAATCLFLAGKAEETPKKSNDIVKFAKLILKEPQFAQFGTDPKEEILTLERILLQTLRFDLEVEHSYDYLIKYVKRLKVHRADSSEDEAHKCLLQSAWTFANDSCCTTLCLQYAPEIVAIAMLFLARKTGHFEMNDWENKKPSIHKDGTFMLMF